MGIGGSRLACGDPQFRHFALAALLAGLLGLGGCAHRNSETVHDEDLTFSDYSGTVSYDADDDEDLADPPVEVHEFDANDAEAAGAHQVIDGNDWMNADDFERNDMLNKAENEAPEGSTIVLVVATGEVWVIPPDDFEAASKVIEPWWDEDRENLAAFVGEDYAPDQLQVEAMGVMGYGTQPLTQGAWANLTGYLDTKITPKPEVVFLHDFNPDGLKYTLGDNSLRIMPYNAWNLESPKLRGLSLGVDARYLNQTDTFQGLGNQAAFAVTVPWGMVYALPEMQLNHLVNSGQVKAWTSDQILGLPFVPLTSNHASRLERFDLGLNFKP